MRHLYIAILFFIYFSLSIICPAQVTEEWVRRYPDTNSFTAGANASAVDDSGNVYITGYTETSTTMGYCTIKYSSAGDRLWVSNYYGEISGGRFAYAIALDRSYNVYVTGYSYRAGTDFDYCTIKYNSSGLQQWVQYYDGPIHGIDQAQKIIVDNAGNIYVSGFSQITGANGFAYTTLKYNANADLVWSRTYPGVDPLTEVKGIAADDSCHLYITGGYGGKAVTVKYDSSGTQLWAQEYYGLSTIGQTWANSLALDDSHNVYVAGLTHGLQTYHDFFTIKYSSQGVQQWVRRYNVDSTDGDNRANSVSVDNAGNVYVSGFGETSNAEPRTITLLKYSNSGDLVWARRDSSSLSSQSTYMAMDRNNNIYVAGGWGLSIPHEAYLTIKYDSAGNRQYKIVYYAQDTISDPRSLIVDDEYNIYLTGRSWDFMCTVKFAQVVSVVSNHSQIPRWFKLHQNYPNPFNTSTIIRFDIPVVHRENAYMTKLIVYDILGRETAVLIKQELKPGNYDVEWNASGYCSGIYFYRIYVGNFTETKKMVLLK